MKYIWTFLILVTLQSCSQIKEKKEPTKITIFEQVSSEIKLLLPLIKNNNLILNSSAINSYENSYALVKENKRYSSEQSFYGITLKRIFNTKNDTISSVHFDFYYDSTNTSLNKNVDSLLNYFVSELGSFKVTFNENMAIYSWNVNNSILDFEVFNNGYTLTFRNGKKTIKPVIIKEQIAKHFSLSEKLIRYILNDSIKLNETTKNDIKTLFPFGLLEKTNVLAFNKTYNKTILLSTSFLFKEEKLEGLYFDYMYSDTETSVVIYDSKIMKQLIMNTFDAPSEVATVELSTSYTWHNILLKLEVYADGYSLVLEEKKEL